MTNTTSEEKRPKLWLVYCILFILSLVSSIFAIYELLLLSSIETLLRFITIGVMIFIDIVLLFRIRKLLHPKKKKKHVILFLFMIIYIAICGTVGYLINFVYSEVSNINKVYVTYTSHLIVPATSDATKISDIKNMKIGILNNKKSVDGYKIPMDIVKENKLEDENELVDYGDYTSMVVDLYANDLDACFVSDSYTTLFSSIAGYENIENDTKIIISKSEKLKKADTSTAETASVGKAITNPFTILLMGIDSTDEVLQKNAVANGDTLILITFNPKTLNATMLSIPRDSYVPIACWAGKAENKITHAAAYGNDCMIKTIENYFDTNIDYYAKINFKGLVKLVDALGGVEVDVEQRLCTDNSNRDGEICIEPGLQVLDGEHALVYARNRKALANGDFGRNYHQQVIIMALMDKVKEIKDASTFMNILNTVSNSVDTNFTTKQILSFYNVAKDIIRKSMSSDEADIVNIERLYLSGSSQMIYDERAKMVLYNYVPNANSRKDIIKAMKENLELAEHTEIKSFNFSVNKEYEKPIIGYGPYKTTGTFSLLPDFTGDTKETATSTCAKIGISCKFIGTGGTVVSQSHPASSRIDKIKELTLTLSQNKTEDDKDKVKDKDKDKTKENDKVKDEDQNENEEVTNNDSDKNKDTTPSDNTNNNNNNNNDDNSSSTESKNEE